MSGLLFNSLVCLAFAATPADSLPQSQQAQLRGPVVSPANSRSPADARREVFTLPDRVALVAPNKDPLIVEVGRSRLLRFPAGISRTALSNVNVSDIVQVGPGEVLVLGKNQGVVNFTVWPSGRDVEPMVFVVRVQRKLNSEQ